MTGVIFDIKEMAVHDGPGVRTTVFLKGCPLRCMWCHNPEGLKIEKQLMFKYNRCTNCGKCFKKCNHPDCQPFGRCLHVCPDDLLSVVGRDVTAKSLAEELILSAKPLGETFSGFTFSGGEPLMQSEFLLELCEELKDHHLCIETSGFAKDEVFKAVIDKMDFVIMDIKIADSKLHKQYIGTDNEQILRNFKTLKQSGKPHIIRTPMIPNITDTKENLERIQTIIGDSEWEKIPYNTMAGAKYKMLGMHYPL